MNVSRSRKVHSYMDGGVSVKGLLEIIYSEIPIARPVINLSEEQDKRVQWEKTAKGRGNKWRMMRDIVACLAMRSMTLIQVQNALMRLRGLSRNKVHEMMMELQNAGDIREVSGDGMIAGTTILGWATSDQGVYFWLENTRKDIPASIVKVLPIMKPVSTSEERKIHARGPSA